MHILAIFLLFLSQYAISAGWTDIVGKNTNGQAIRVIEEDNGLLSVVILVGDKQVKKYPKEPCNFKETRNGWEFSCGKSGKSPLSGATYLMKMDECGGHDLTCKSGCPLSAPKTMYQDPWEYACETEYATP